MEQELANEIIACLPGERTIFHYCKDRYAPMLLKHFVGSGMDIGAVKRSHMAGLINKPTIREFLSSLGNGILTAEKLNNFWIDDVYSFVLTLSQWGGKKPDWNQTTRKGYNLVLQLNFSNRHDTAYKRLAKPNFTRALNYWGHPVFSKTNASYFRETLAWARIDLDFVTGEALIEEIQSDWVRIGNYVLNIAKRYKQCGKLEFDRWNIRGQVDDVIEYCEKVLKPYQAIWSEAMLAATVEFIKTELGIDMIYYHSFNTGCRLKKTGEKSPPKSIYDKLPRKFCFTKTYYEPKFLNNDKYFSRNYRKIWYPEWFTLRI